jgi:hypothetical protein
MRQLADLDTAERLMAISQDPVISNATHGSLLPPSWMTLYELTKLPAEALEAGIAEGSINPAIQRKEVAALRRPVARSCSRLLRDIGCVHR